tara:strand:- start:46 stop:231 length:186 start_codon:yes stop_codon:yes gene_type:complete
MINNLIDEYIVQFPKTGFPMQLLYAYGEDQTVVILKEREGRQIKWIIADKDVRDGGEFIYV